MKTEIRDGYTTYTYTDPQTGWRFVWQGGAYIDVHTVKGGVFTAIDVWDHGEDIPRIVPEQFTATCQEWLETYRDSAEQEGY